MTDNNSDYSDLQESVTTYPKSHPSERELILRGDRNDDDGARMSVYCDIKGVNRRILGHPEFELTEYETSDGDGGWMRIDAEEYEEDGHDKRKPVYAVRGTIPHNIVKISRGDGRDNDSVTEIVTDEYTASTPQGDSGGGFVDE